MINCSENKLECFRFTNIKVVVCQKHLSRTRVTPARGSISSHQIVYWLYLIKHRFIPIYLKWFYFRYNFESSGFGTRKLRHHAHLIRRIPLAALFHSSRFTFGNFWSVQSPLRFIIIVTVLKWDVFKVLFVDLSWKNEIQYVSIHNNVEFNWC